MNKIRELHRSIPARKTNDYIAALRTYLISILSQYPAGLIDVVQGQRPMVILIVGVNGNGKTTSVAKLAHLMKQNEKKVLVAAADTFRAAAIEQLETWAQRLQIDIVKGAPRSDPASVAFDGVQAGKARQL